MMGSITAPGVESEPPFGRLTGRSAGIVPVATLLTNVAAKATWVSMSSATCVARTSGVGVCAGRAVGVAVGVGAKAMPFCMASCITPMPSRIKMAASTLMVTTRAVRLVAVRFVAGCCGCGCGCGCGADGMDMASSWRMD